MMNQREPPKTCEREYYEGLLKNEVPPVNLGNKNKSGKCGMCGTKVSNLYPCKVGQVKLMICGNCKSIMDM